MNQTPRITKADFEKLGNTVHEEYDYAIINGQTYPFEDRNIIIEISGKVHIMTGLRSKYECADLVCFKINDDLSAIFAKEPKIKHPLVKRYRGNRDIYVEFRDRWRDRSVSKHIINDNTDGFDQTATKLNFPFEDDYEYTLIDFTREKNLFGLSEFSKLRFIKSNVIIDMATKKRIVDRSRQKFISIAYLTKFKVINTCFSDLYPLNDFPANEPSLNICYYFTRDSFQKIDFVPLGETFTRIGKIDEDEDWIYTTEPSFRHWQFLQIRPADYYMVSKKLTKERAIKERSLLLEDVIVYEPGETIPALLRNYRRTNFNNALDLFSRILKSKVNLTDDDKIKMIEILRGPKKPEDESVSFRDSDDDLSDMEEDHSEKRLIGRIYLEDKYTERYIDTKIDYNDDYRLNRDNLLTKSDPKRYSVNTFSRRFNSFVEEYRDILQGSFISGLGLLAGIYTQFKAPMVIDIYCDVQKLGAAFHARGWLSFATDKYVHMQKDGFDIMLKNPQLYNDKYFSSSKIIWTPENGYNMTGEIANGIVSFLEDEDILTTDKFGNDCLIGNVLDQMIDILNRGLKIRISKKSIFNERMILYQITKRHVFANHYWVKKNLVNKHLVRFFNHTSENVFEFCKLITEIKNI